MTECTQNSLEFENHFSRDVVARFDGGALTSDADALLLRDVDRRINLTSRLAECFDDHRSTLLGRHIVVQIRTKWADARIVVCADSGFCREELMEWCERHGVGFVLGFERNERLRRMIAPQMEEVAQRQQATGKPARVFTEFEYQTTAGPWTKARRVVTKAEQIEGEENPRFVVTYLIAEQS